MDIIGNQYLADFGMAKAILLLDNESSLTFTITEKEGKPMDETETVAAEVTQLRAQLYMLTWKEKNGNTVTQVQDHENGVAYNNWTSPTGEFIHAKGTLKKL